MITHIVDDAVAARGLDERDFKTAVIDGLKEHAEPARSEQLARFLDDEDRVARLKAYGELSPAARARADRTSADRPSTFSVDTRRHPRALALARGNPRAKVVTNRGSFTIELLAREAPLTVESFVSLARKGFFDGQKIPRVVPDFVVQMGDPRGDWSGGPGYAIRCEITPLPYARGTVGMALSGKDTGGSQFFVTLSRQPHLDAGYTIFGRVTSGMNVVDALQRGDQLLHVTLD